jgi:hypothetical protein
MKIKLPITTEIEVTHLHMMLPVNYGEEEIPNDFPFRKNDSWSVVVELDTGMIVDWPKGKSADVHLTVKDGGTYELVGNDGRIVAAIEGDYVPHGIVPGSYGDTVELKIAADGCVTNWPRTPSAKDFFHESD